MEEHPPQKKGEQRWSARGKEALQSDFSFMHQQRGRKKRTKGNMGVLSLSHDSRERVCRKFRGYQVSIRGEVLDTRGSTDTLLQGRYCFMLVPKIIIGERLKGALAKEEHCQPTIRIDLDRESKPERISSCWKLYHKTREKGCFDLVRLQNEGNQRLCALSEWLR